MKAIIKILFAAFILYYAATIVNSTNDPLIVMITVLGTVSLITGLIVPARYFIMNQLNVVTDVKVWNKYIIEKLRRVNDWMTRSRDESRYVLGGAVVYIPQAGADPAIVVNRNAYPAVAVQRTDSDVNYALDSYSTDPTHVAWAELQTISYDKMDSVLSAHTNALAEAVGDVMLTKWAPSTAAQTVVTTGADVPAVGTQVGTRKGFTQKDLATAMIKMNVNNVPKQNRVAVFDDNMYGFFYDDLSANQMNAFNQFADNATGKVGRLHGFDIYTRSSVLAYATGGYAANAYAAAIAATDNLATLCYQQDMVARAIGESKLFADKDNPLYYGDLASMILRAGGRKLRADNVGVVAIVQGQ